MTKEEFGILAKGLKAVYTMPSFLPDNYSLGVWYSLLKDLEYGVVNVAIQKYMMTETKIPTPADIRKMATDVKLGDKPLWGDGWEEVMRAVRRYGYIDEVKALESMSELTRQCVRRMGYQNICRSEEIGVERANFRMIFEQMANREYEKAQIPMSVQNLIASMKLKGVEQCDNKNTLTITEQDS